MDVRIVAHTNPNNTTNNNSPADRGLRLGSCGGGEARGDASGEETLLEGAEPGEELRLHADGVLTPLPVAAAPAPPPADAPGVGVLGTVLPMLTLRGEGRCSQTHRIALRFGLLSLSSDSSYVP